MDLFDLLAGSANRTFDMEMAKEHAHSIANMYLRASCDPTTELTKMASQNGFTTEQIKVVAGEVNKAIHAALYKTAEDKYHAANFPLVDFKKIIGSLQLNDGEVKVAGQFVDPIIPQKDQFNFYSAFAVEEEALDKTASVSEQMKMAGQKLELLSQKLSDAITMKQHDVYQAESNFIKQARQMIFENSITPYDRFRTLGTVYHLAKVAGKHDTAARPLAKLAYALGKEGLIERSKSEQSFNFFTKHADQQVPENMISKELTGVEVINGNHPLYITLDTLETHKRALEGFENRFKKVQDTLEGLSQRIRAI